MRVHILPSVAFGSVQAPCSKSLFHRYLLCAALANGKSQICHASPCEDTKATMECLREMGAEFSWDQDCLYVSGMKRVNVLSQTKLYCASSASTLRFLLPIALLQKEKVTFSLDGSLAARPMDVYETMCKEHGYFYEKKGNAITVCGPIRSGKYEIPGDVSSQFITGLLFSLSLVEGDSEILITTPLESSSYVRMTMEVIQMAGIRTSWHGQTIHIFGSQSYECRKYDLEADASAAANLYALNVLGGDVDVLNMRQSMLQGDAIFPKLFDQIVAGNPEISLEDCPDLGPILMAMAAVNSGATFTHVHRLRYKESDRLLSMQEELMKIGVEMTIHQDECTIVASKAEAPEVCLSGHNDHRIAMAMAILLTEVGGYLEGAEAVEKSYPYFFDDLRRLGIIILEE